MKIAVIGAGIAGMGAAWLLNRKHEVTLYERNAYIGGHSHTVDVAFPDHTIPVDTGFIVYNEPNYPNLKALFAELRVETIPTIMSFAVSVDDGRFEYAGTNLATVFANKGNTLRPYFWRMLYDILKFNRYAAKILQRDESITLGAYLDRLGMSQAFRKYYLLPMAGAIWSCPPETMLAYPASSFIRFFENHGLLTVNEQPVWHTVKGGSREYVKKLTASLHGRILPNTPVKQVYRQGEKACLVTFAGERHEYDHIVLATHGDEALEMLSDATEQERNVLQAFHYQKNRAVLHSDISLMPRKRACWSSWVYHSGKNADGAIAISVTYWMNRLQSIDERYPLFVTLNPLREPSPHTVHGEYSYDHPVFTQDTLLAQQRMESIQADHGVSFCGSYHRYGFHEDGLTAGIQAANRLGVRAPWQ